MPEAKKKKSVFQLPVSEFKALRKRRKKLAKKVDKSGVFAELAKELKKKS